MKNHGQPDGSFYNVNLAGLRGYLEKHYLGVSVRVSPKLKYVLACSTWGDPSSIWAVTSTGGDWGDEVQKAHCCRCENWDSSALALQFRSWSLDSDIYTTIPVPAFRLLAPKWELHPWLLGCGGPCVWSKQHHQHPGLQESYLRISRPS